MLNFLIKKKFDYSHGISKPHGTVPHRSLVRKLFFAEIVLFSLSKTDFAESVADLAPVPDNVHSELIQKMVRKLGGLI